MNVIFDATDVAAAQVKFLAERATHVAVHKVGHTSLKFAATSKPVGDEIVVVTEPLREDVAGPCDMVVLDAGATVAVLGFGGRITKGDRVVIRLSLNGCTIATERPRLENTSVGDWCQPGYKSRRQFVVIFEDKDRGMAAFEDEAQAREFFARAEHNGFNCYLMGTMPRE